MNAKSIKNLSKNDTQDGMLYFVSKRNMWSSWDNLKSLQNAPQTPLRRPPGLPRRPQDAPKTAPRRLQNAPKTPFCFQDAPGCPLDAPGAPRESLQEAPGLDFGWIPDPQILGNPPRNLSRSGRRTDGQTDRWTDVSAVAGTQLCCALDNIHVFFGFLSLFLS